MNQNKSICKTPLGECGCDCSITHITPISGPSEGGNNIIVYGKNLNHVTQIFFGKHKITSFVLLNNCSIKFRALPMDNNKNIKISVSCYYTKSNQVCYSYNEIISNIPEIINYDPISGPQNGGNQLLL